MTKTEWIVSAGFLAGLGLGITLCLKGIFGGAPSANPSPFPVPPSFLGFYGMGEDEVYSAWMPRGNYGLPP